MCSASSKLIFHWCAWRTPCFSVPSILPPPSTSSSFEHIWRESLQRVVEDGQMAGEFRSVASVDVAYALMGLTDTCVERQMHPGFDPVGRDGLRKIVNLLLDGVATEGSALSPRRTPATAVDTWGGIRVSQLRKIPVVRNTIAVNGRRTDLMIRMARTFRWLLPDSRCWRLRRAEATECRPECQPGPGRIHASAGGGERSPR